METTPSPPPTSNPSSQNSFKDVAKKVKIMTNIVNKFQSLVKTKDEMLNTNKPVDVVNGLLQVAIDLHTNQNTQNGGGGGSDENNNVILNYCADIAKLKLDTIIDDTKEISIGETNKIIVDKLTTVKNIFYKFQESDKDDPFIKKNINDLEMMIKAFNVSSFKQKPILRATAGIVGIISGVLFIPAAIGEQIIFHGAVEGLCQVIKLCSHAVFNPSKLDSLNFKDNMESYNTLNSNIKKYIEYITQKYTTNDNLQNQNSSVVNNANTNDDEDNFPDLEVEGGKKNVTKKHKKIRKNKKNKKNTKKIY